MSKAVLCRLGYLAEVIRKTDLLTFAPSPLGREWGKNISFKPGAFSPMTKGGSILDMFDRGQPCKSLDIQYSSRVFVVDEMHDTQPVICIMCTVFLTLGGPECVRIIGIWFR